MHRDASPSAAPSIEIVDVAHRYGDREALRGISIDVRRGEIFGFLGPNGSGKSTLFKILSTLLAPTSGTARIEGADVTNDAAAVRARIGMTFQSPSLDIKLSCAENLVHRGHLYGMSGADLRERVTQSLERFGLAARHDAKVETLSGGLRRRVELAATLLHEPRVLLLDEPATGLDPTARTEMWEHLVRLRDESDVTVALTTHLMEEADRCDRLAILDEGTLVASGTPDELRAGLGGDVIDIDTRDPDALVPRLREKLGVDASVVAGRARIENADGRAVLGELLREFESDVEAVRVGKPTLGDVFLARTGRSFRDVDEAARRAKEEAAGRRSRRKRRA